MIEGRHNGIHDGHEKHGGGSAFGRGRGGHHRCGGVAVVLLAEAEPAPPVALRHAHVVHDEEVYLELRGARPPDVKGRCKETGFDGVKGRESGA